MGLLKKSKAFWAAFFCKETAMKNLFGNIFRAKTEKQAEPLSDETLEKIISEIKAETSVPCMKLVKLNGGRSIGVYQGDDVSQVCDLIRHDRVNYITRADYRFDQELASIVKKLIVSIKKEEELEDIAKLHQSKAL